ncbi:tyrosine-type recombinase/integrase [candidate division KSB1 bacterium]|nr:tyrosine-type recombinase/integrase [candidate division KSB1 bacterium]
MKDQFKNALKRAGLQRERVHDLRGSWATRMNENGVDAYTIMKIGGWSSLSVLKRYLRRNQKNCAIAGFYCRKSSKELSQNKVGIDFTDSKILKIPKVVKSLWILIDAKILKNKNHICKTSYF